MNVTTGSGAISDTGRRTPTLIVLGGFLGAGKTTLILTAARLLRIRGLRAAAILNDQGTDLVDTQYVRQNGLDADQVAGGCFCCRFSDLIDAAERLTEYAPDVIFAEAVGSCTDISATTLQPLLLYYRQQFRLAPYTVLADPGRARECARAPDSDIAFLFHKQLEEADLVCLTKTDCYSDFPSWPGISQRYLSPLTGEGVAAWLDEVLSEEQRAGQHTLDIDYERYARAEAGLAWLNCRVELRLTEAQTPAAVVGPLLERLDDLLSEHNIDIAHLKLFDECASGYIKASIVRNGQAPRVEGILTAAAEKRHDLLLNIRALSQPALLQGLAANELTQLAGDVLVHRMQCFRPAAPQPEHRFSAVEVEA